MAKKVAGKKTGFSVQGFDLAHYKRTEDYVAAIDRLYNQAIAEFARIATRVKVSDPEKPFTFDDFPATKAAASNIINGLASKMKAVIQTGSREQWLYACKKNDAFLQSIMDISKVSKKVLSKYQDRNLDALDAFQKRKVWGMDLSERIWKQADQFKKSMELGIDVGIGEGRSAQQLSQDLRQNLLDPDRLFRRVRDKRGQLQLSKAAQAFHPGQGVYRSSYKNAMRLTRSEVNMAYRDSDLLRWGGLDFVVGFEVKLSNNHTLNGKPFVDICDDLAGRYPKNFVFKGWHPQCRCFAIPILQDPYEFDTDELNELKGAFKGTEYKKYVSKNTVTDLPENFKNWMGQNQAKVDGYKSTPYFVKDNFKKGKIAEGLRFDTTAIKKPVKSPEQKKAIIAKWEDRKARYDAILAEGKAVLQKALEFPEIDTATLQKQVGSYNIKSIGSESKLLQEKVQAAMAEETQLSTLLDNVKGLKAQHGIEATRDAFKAVESKLAEFETMSLEQQKKKLEFEIGFVEQKQKYSTWKGAQDAYKKQLSKVDYQIAKIAVQDALTGSFQYAVKTISKNVKSMAEELKQLLSEDAPLSTLQSKAKALNSEVAKLEAKKAAANARKNTIKLDNIDENQYSQARKDKALWAKTAKDADKNVRGVCSEVWKAAVEAEKVAAYRYTAGSSYINEPLRSMHYSGQYAGKYNGKVDAENLKSLINRSSYDFDMWVQRGVGTEAVKGVFGVDIYGRSLAEARSVLLGKVGTEHGFSSCGNSKGTGFSDRAVTYNIYCPKGTKMLYSEPFSAFGHGAKSASWDGAQKQTNFGYEAEMVLQCGTQFRVVKIDQSGGRWYIDVEVVAQ